MEVLCPWSPNQHTIRQQSWSCLTLFHMNKITHSIYLQSKGKKSSVAQYSPGYFKKVHIKKQMDVGNSIAYTVDVRGNSLHT